LVASAAIGWAVHVAVEKPLLGASEERPSFLKKRSKKLLLLRSGLRSDTGTSSSRRLNVTVLAGGGLSPLSGGVGILLGNLQELWAQSEAAPHLRIIDTRGPGGRGMAVPMFLAACAKFLWLGLSGRTQLVHAHMTTRGSAARKTFLCWLAMAMGIPVILHMHGADFVPFFRRLHPALRAPLRTVLLRARHVVVLGHAWRDFLVREVGLRPDRISIVPNGVPQCHATPPKPQGVPHILFLGRLCARKGVPDLIAALASPHLRALPWHATIAGDGNAAPYRAMLSWHRLDCRVAVPGWADRAETARLLASADMLVLPSYHEAMPLSVLEALAAGVPVVATPVGSLPDILKNEENALLVPPGDPAALADAIARLLRSKELRLSLAQAGYETFRQKLEIGAVAERIAALYRKTVAPAEAAE
jgi:glycosyltransferase involved in cell wall biosynthesis